MINTRKYDYIYILFQCGMYFQRSIKRRFYVIRVFIAFVWQINIIFFMIRLSSCEI